MIHLQAITPTTNTEEAGKHQIRSLVVIRCGNIIISDRPLMSCSMSKKSLGRVVHAENPRKRAIKH
jgi:hypothetical protein